MKPALLLALGLTVSISTTTTHAQIYQWKDSSGRTVVSDTPPSGPASRDSRTIGNRSPVERGETPVEKPPEAQKTIADKELEFKRRQLESREKKEKEAREEQARNNREENCRRARGNLAALESNRLVGTFDEKGERRVYDNAERQQEIERTRQSVKELCQ
jgi:hypothetical protein